MTEQNRYDVILMDVQMPGMNGLEATAAIRRREKERRRERVPIIAMTAHAMRGDRERCLAAGMDGYLSKPVNAQEMIGLVESLARGAGPVAWPAAAATPSPIETSPQATAVVFNPDEALSRCFNSQDMVREMIQCFFDEVDNLFPQMRAALARGDLVEVGRLGHRMKGTVVYLGAQPAKQAALRVERFCKSSGGTPIRSGGSHQRARARVHGVESRIERASAGGRTEAQRPAGPGVKSAVGQDVERDSPLVPPVGRCGRRGGLDRCERFEDLVDMGGAFGHDWFRLGEQPFHLVIRGRYKVLVPHAYGKERFRRDRANSLVDELKLPHEKHVERSMKRLGYANDVPDRYLTSSHHTDRRGDFPGLASRSTTSTISTASNGLAR